MLFVVTELEKPVGGLYRFSAEYLKTWRKLRAKGKTKFEPLVFSLKDEFSPPNDLVESRKFADLPDNCKVFEGKRGDVDCFFLQSTLSDKRLEEFQTRLYNEYGINSWGAKSWNFYMQLNSFWKHLPLVVERFKNEIVLVDCQDWLAFPAGVRLKEEFGFPLYCRFHSNEYGRALGEPNYDSPQLTSEVLALQEADFIQSVSVTEANFLVRNYLPLKRDLRKRLEKSKPKKWVEQQKNIEEGYRAFLRQKLDERKQNALELFSERVGALPNAIVLDPWKEATGKDIQAGVELYSQLLPKSKFKCLFIGRPTHIKGIYVLLEALKLLHDKGNKEIGLVVASHFDEEALKAFLKHIQELGISESVSVRNGWVDEDTKKRLFCAADAIVLPSLYEPFGIVVLEALAADYACEKNGARGPITIVSDCGGMSETIADGVNGLKIPLKARFKIDAADLAVVLEKARETQGLKQKLSAGGAKQALNSHYTWESVLEKSFDFYDRAIENAGKNQFGAVLRKIKDSLAEPSTTPLHSLKAFGKKIRWENGENEGAKS